MIFRYRWAALLFVLLVVGGAVRLVGTEEGGGELAEVQRELLEQRQQFEQATSPDADLPIPEIEEEYAEPEDSFTDDAELVHQAEGYDPSPDEPEETQPASSAEKPVQLVAAEGEQS